MTAVKIECDCGQRYAFDVEPVYGPMPAPVACPACGADGTAKANTILAQTAVAASPVRISAPIRVDAAPVAVAGPASALRVAVATPVFNSAPVALAPAGAAHEAVAAPSSPPPIPPSLPPPRAVAVAAPPMAPSRAEVSPGRLPAPRNRRAVKTAGTVPKPASTSLGNTLPLRRRYWLLWLRGFSSGFLRSF